uniref:Ovule protein n=1 Tax=Anisakis simplex TaxID=6269 RepID=A0A0M3JQH4_ANISI
LWNVIQAPPSIRLVVAHLQRHITVKRNRCAIHSRKMMPPPTIIIITTTAPKKGHLNDIIIALYCQ